MENGTRDHAVLAAVARRLRALRYAHGAKLGVKDYSIAAFSNALGIKRERYARYERAELGAPMEVLIAIQKLTGVSLDMLIAGRVAGNDTLIDRRGLAEGEFSVGDRLRMVRLILEPSVERTAALMDVDVATWLAWESGAAIPPVDALIQFSRQFGDQHRVGLDFLYRGILDGIAAEFGEELLRRNPELLPASAPSDVKPSGHRTRSRPRSIAPVRKRARPTSNG